MILGCHYWWKWLSFCEFLSFADCISLSAWDEFSENLFYFIERWFFGKIANSVIKMTSFAHGGISIKMFCQICTSDIWNFKPQIWPIFHFEHVNEWWISGVSSVKKDRIFIWDATNIYSALLILSWLL